MARWRNYKDTIEVYHTNFALGDWAHEFLAAVDNAGIPLWRIRNQYHGIEARIPRAYLPQIERIRAEVDKTRHARYTRKMSCENQEND